jgi:hypothetical protein
MKETLLVPVDPYRGVRGIDAWGAGGFGAPRGGRRHPGIDLVTVPGDIVRAPGSCRADRIGTVYAGSGLTFVHLSALEWHARLLYVAPSPDLMLNSNLTAGTPLGIAQDVAAYYRAQDPTREDITNHVHFEVFLLSDPTLLLWPLAEGGPGMVTT